MSDAVDRGNDRAQEELDELLAIRRPVRQATATGFCLHCEAEFDGSRRNHRWCNAECRDDWQKRNPDHRQFRDREPIISGGGNGIYADYTGNHRRIDRGNDSDARLIAGLE